MSKASNWNRKRREQLELYHDLPQKARGLGDLLTFAEWLQATGRLPVMPTNEFETARWRNLDNRTCIIYHDQQGYLTWEPNAAADFRAYLAARSNDDPASPSSGPHVMGVD